jgi:hypothetical protein
MQYILLSPEYCSDEFIASEGMKILKYKTL